MTRFSQRAAALGHRLPHLATALGAAAVAAGPVALALDVELGVLRAPFYVQIAPVLTWWAAPAAAGLVLGLLAARRLLAPQLRPAAFAAASLALALGLRLALNVAREGPAGWYRVFGDAWEGQFEYLPALPALRLGTLTFLDRFAEFSASLPIHPSAHPPGMVLLLHALGIGSPRANATLVVVAGALTVPLTYVLGRELLGEPRARIAALFCAFAPSALLYGATSADALFATLGLAAAAALVARRPLLAAAGPALLFGATFFSYALSGAGAWAVLVVARVRGLRRALVLALASGLALIGGYAALYALTGFDLIGTLEAANSAYVRGISSQRPYWYWLVGSPTAFFGALGLPLAWLALRAAGRAEPAGLALLAVIAVAVLLGFTKAENERIWLFLVGPACVAAASQVRERSVTAVLVALAAQAMLVQVLLDTRW